MIRVIVTMMVGIRLGKISRERIRREGTPRAVAARAHSLRARTRVSPRTTLAIGVQ